MMGGFAWLLAYITSRIQSSFDGFVDNWASTSLYATSLTVLIAIVGCLASVFSLEIKSSFPIYLGKSGWDWPYIEVVCFWFLLVVTGVLYFGRSAAENRNQANLVRATRDIDKLIRTLPPEDFLQIYADLYRGADQATSLALSNGKVDRETVVQSARHVMQAIAILAQTFGRRLGEDGTQYAANIMQFKAAQDIGDNERIELDQVLRFCEDGVCCAKLRGILDLDIDLSVRANDEKVGPDHEMERMVLPVPVAEHDGHNHYRALPGAPMAFVTEAASCFANCQDLYDWCSEKGDFSRSLRNRIREYFDEADHIGSLLSVCILIDDAPTAVLNIHCNLPNLLGEGTNDADQNGTVSQFVMITEPLRALLSRLLMSLDELDD